MKTYATLLATLTLVMPAVAQTKWYAPDAASKQSISDALDTAGKANHRVIVIYSGDWCTLCEEVHAAAMADPQVPQILQSGYQMVQVPVTDFAALQDFATKTLHAKIDKANALLILLLEKDGSVLSTWTAPRLSDAGHISAAKVKAQLSEFVLGSTADDVYHKSIAALPAGKTGWVEFRADWCGWCKKMEKFFQDSDAAPILAKYYSVIAIDTEKNEGAEKLARGLGSVNGTDGIPWFGVVDSKGKVLATSEGPKGNIGYPDSDVEVAHFMSVLKSTATGITTAELDKVSKTIEALKVKPATTGNH